MIGYSDAPQAWSQTRGMARVLKVNLPDAVVSGLLTRKELGQIVDQCQSCPHTEQCLHWLAKATTAPCLPVFCPNRSVLLGLAESR